MSKKGEKEREKRRKEGERKKRKKDLKIIIGCSIIVVEKRKLRLFN
mgnify:CR=1 FL=1